MDNFKKWERAFANGDLLYFTHDREALLWLKIKSFSRRETIDDFLTSNNIILSSRTLKDQFHELFDLLSKNLEKSHKLLSEYFILENTKELNKLDVKKLVTDLYKVKHFDWGGDYQNALDKYLVRKYVKEISSYDLLISKLDTEVIHTVKNYILNSWYNNWTSILIEYIFKSHSKVLPTVGKIKSVDFFIDDIPIDLKVTNLPVGYINQIRREKNLGNELTYLKRQARSLDIPFDPSLNDSDLYYSITEAMSDIITNSTSDLFGKNEASIICKETLDKVKSDRQLIINSIKYDDSVILKWLYENQGDMRFGSENRLFIVLLDNDKWEDSWKLKRNFDLLKANIIKYLDDFSFEKLKKISFSYDGKEYETYSDIIFIISNE